MTLALALAMKSYHVIKSNRAIIAVSLSTFCFDILMLRLPSLSPPLYHTRHTPMTVKHQAHGYEFGGP
jgi:hypothetical protein